VVENVDQQGITANDRLSLLHSVSFKSATSHLVYSLMSGACLLPYDVKSQGLHGFADWLRDERITLCHLPPAVFRTFADALKDRNHFPDLRLICLSGSVVTSTEFESFRDKIGRATQLEISMGCTEVGWATSAIIPDGFVFPVEGDPIGYPYRGKKILVLDDEGHEVAHGEIGEIAVKSPYLSPGYWQNPELTRAKFLPDPEGGAERIYLTGDLGRMMPDGFLIHLGRKDLMVKIRGYRVELEEVERELLKHPGVEDTALAVRDRKNGEKCLVAYVVSRSQPGPTVDELRGFLRHKLTDYMIPSAFVMLDALPMTPNWKVDRRALPDPDKSRPELDTPFVAPRTPIEEELARLWCQVLSVDQVGIHDNFFDLGGHSLAATRIVSEVIRGFQLEIPLQSLFRSPTVAEMAAVITANQRKKLGQTEMESILTELESLTEEEAERLLGNQNDTGHEKHSDE
jgi:acyl-coenzyme A synthetase/AMP-(fatty) acid ligase/acyl carrier protein